MTVASKTQDDVAAALAPGDADRGNGLYGVCEPSVLIRPQLEQPPQVAPKRVPPLIVADHEGVLRVRQELVLVALELSGLSKVRRSFRSHARTFAPGDGRHYRAGASPRRIADPRAPRRSRGSVHDRFFQGAGVDTLTSALRKTDRLAQE